MLDVEGQRFRVSSTYSIIVQALLIKMRAQGEQ